MTGPLLLVRHASAGSRADWQGDDLLRPLDERGRRQAEALPALLAGYEVARVLTSPFARCRETVEPLACALGLPLEERAELAEGARREDALALVHELEGTTAVLCTHGDVVEELLGEQSRKGSTWVLDPGPDDRLGRREYLPPGG